MLVEKGEKPFLARHQGLKEAQHEVPRRKWRLCLLCHLARVKRGFTDSYLFVTSKA
jgi:hypothetical protein